MLCLADYMCTGTFGSHRMKLFLALMHLINITEICLFSYMEK